MIGLEVAGSLSMLRITCSTGTPIWSSVEPDRSKCFSLGRLATRSLSTKENVFQKDFVKIE